MRREVIEAEYVYLGATRARSKVQLEHRRWQVVAPQAAEPTLALEVEVLTEVIHGARVPVPDAATLVERLRARGVSATVTAVTTVLERRGLGKKTPPSRWRRSRR